jgi:predicted small secreted protein
VARLLASRDKCAHLADPDLNKGKIMIRLIAWMLIAGTAVLAGCNTMAGAGQDISKGGQAIKNEAQESK